MKNLVIVFTPLQFLNGIEFFKKKKEEFELIVLTSEKRNIEQIKTLDINMLCKFPLDRITFLNDDLLWFVKLYYVILFLRPKKYNRLVLGNYNNLVGYYCSLKFNEKGKEIILLDDGLASVKIYIDRNRHNKLYNDNLFGGKGIKLFKGMFGINNGRIINHLIFFTSYNLEKLQRSSQDYVWINDKVGENSKKKINPNLVWFIGSPVVESKIINLNDFQIIIDKLISKFKEDGKDLIYVMHRFEKKKIPNLKYERFDKPLEVVFQQREELPSTVISFYSSALINLASIHRGFRFLYININEFTIDGHLSTVYDLFKIHNNLSELIF